ncbi:MAG TPA: hypothetical protein VF635_10825 [Propionibacteriaceae bacterium]
MLSPTPSPALDAQPVKLNAKPVAAEYGFGAAWVSIDAGTSDDPRVVRIDHRTKKVGLTVKGPHRVGVGTDAIWGAGSPEYMGKSTLRKFDPMTGKTLLAVQAPYPFDVSVARQAVWITTMQDGVGRVNPRTGAIKLMRLPSEDVPDYILATDAAVWVSSRDSGQVYRIDPDTNKVVAKIEAPTPKDMVAYAGSIWVGSDDGPVARIDADTNRVTVIPGIGSVKAITAWGDAVWAPHRDAGVYQIDPATNEAELALPFEPDTHLGIACGDGELWVTSISDFAVYHHTLG